MSLFTIAAVSAGVVVAAQSGTWVFSAPAVHDKGPGECVDDGALVYDRTSRKVFVCESDRWEYVVSNNEGVPIYSAKFNVDLETGQITVMNVLGGSWIISASQINNLPGQFSVLHKLESPNCSCTTFDDKGGNSYCYFGEEAAENEIKPLIFRPNQNNANVNASFNLICQSTEISN